MKLLGASGPTVGCALAQKIGAPASIRPMVWCLPANQEADNIDVVVKLIQWYRARWEIEMVRHVLKNGCRVEAVQLLKIDRVQRTLAVPTKVI